MKQWITRICYPMIKGINIVLFAWFVPKKRKLYLWEKVIYRELIKLVKLEHRLMVKICKPIATS